MNRFGKVEGAAERDLLEQEEMGLLNCKHRALGSGDPSRVAHKTEQLEKHRRRMAYNPHARNDTSSSSIDHDECFERLVQFYSSMDPTKLDAIPKLMSKYQGKELKLIQTIESKYGLDPGSI